MNGEEWRPVSGFEGQYEVSSNGRVRSLDRTIIKSDGRVCKFKGKVLNLNANSHGYVTARFPKRSAVGVHRLVAEAFIPNPEGLPNVLHWDDNPTNNRKENLRWGTQRDNIRDILRNGNHDQANRTHCPAGHEYTAENTGTYTTKQGWKSRHCRACRKQKYEEKRDSR